MPESGLTYFQQYYRKHRAAIATRRKRRYDSDEQYKETVKQRSRQRYRDLRKQHRRSRPAREPRTGPAQRIHTDGTAIFSVGAFAERINRNIKTINKWERNGVLPKPTVVDAFEHRWYSEEHMGLIASLIRRHQTPKGYIRQAKFKKIVQRAWKNRNGQAGNGQGSKR